jgi:hypothetical protein
MRRFLIVLWALLLVLAPLVSSVGQDSGPRAVPVEPIKDFQIVPKGEWIHHEFRIRNEGNAPLELTDVRPACGCTVAEFDRKIAPGQTGAVKVKVETSSFTGPIAKPISVFTNDPKNPKIELTVKADVKPYLGVEPGYARFIYVQGEDIRPINQVLWSQDGLDFNVVSVKAPYEYVDVKYREARPEERNDEATGRQWTVEVHLDPLAPIGALRDYVEVVLDHPKQKSVRLPLSGFVRPRQHVTPQEIDFGTVDGGSLPLQRVVTFTNFITKGIAVTRAETGFDGLQVDVQEVGRKDGHRFELVLTIGPGMPKGEFQSTLKLHITDNQNPVFEVPISGTIL